MTSYFQLDQETKEALLNQGARQMDRRSEVLEKDIWVCWALDILFDGSDTTRMAFKGGTSLSKAYNLIQRFSEDVDITIDYRDLDPQELRLGDPLSGTQRKRLSEKLRSRAADHVRNVIDPKFQAAGAAALCWGYGNPG